MISLRYLLVFVAVSFCVLDVCYGGVAGGLGPERKITEEVARIADTLKAAVETRLGVQIQTYEPISFASQVVNGVNYFIKIDVGDQTIVVRAYRSLTGAVSLHSVKVNQTAESPIVYFDCGGAGTC